MRKLVVLVVVLGVLTTIGAAGAAAVSRAFPTVPGNWSHVDINRKIGRKWHTLSLDRGRITQVSATQLTLREPDASVTIIPLTPQAIVRVFGSDTSIYALRRGMNATTMRIDGGPAVRIRVVALSTLNGMSGTVLLVEDEPSVGELVRGYLSRDGYRVIWVRNGEEALVELERHPIRLVLLDIGLPGKDGFDVCREMRAAFARADPDADRARRGAGPDRRARGRRRRLHHEAVLAARARRADEGGPPAQRAAGSPRHRSSSATCCSTASRTTSPSPASPSS